MIDVDELCQKINQKHGKGWSIYEAAAGGWVFQSPNRNWTVSNTTLSGVLVAGLDFTELQKIPPKPELFARSEYSVVKEGSKWAIKGRGYSACGNIATKKYAEECIDRWSAHNASKRDNWDAVHGQQVEGKIEGVDFVYAE